MPDPRGPRPTEPAATGFAEVALPLPIDYPLTYAVPRALAERIEVGMRAIVPVQNRTETGFVLAVKTHCDLDRVKSIIDLPDSEPVVSPIMIALAAWIAEYYCCSHGEALLNALPAGFRARSVTRYRLILERLETGRYSDRQKKVIAELHRSGPLTAPQLAKAVGATALSNTLQALVARGVLEAESSIHSHGVSMKTEAWVRLIEAAVPANEALAEMQRRAPRRAAVLLDLLHGEPERLASVLYERHKVTSAVLAALEAAGFIERVEREVFRAPEFEADEKARVPFVLNPEQQAALDGILQAADAAQFRTFLLRGITGSGKTEVYLQAIEHVLAQGRSAILLVPEISLTPQTVGRFIGRFRERIAVLHSGLGKGERFDEWRRARQGDVRIVVGARSAVFAPLPDVGIIIVDEEHDLSYKQNETPRYHARDVAIMRAHFENAVCVLGSATPSIETYFKSEASKFVRLDLTRRATSSPLPEVRVIDMRAETREVGGEVILARALDEAVHDRVTRGEQVILLLNRRGFAPFVLCPKCGWVAQCADCNVSYTYHASGAFMSCHYCGARAEVPSLCGVCGFNPLLFLGTGTQKVEQHLMKAFSGARIERMDADTTAGKGGHAKILGRFAAGQIDILIGTQMIAKGHDYPGVTLVGVLNADTGLSIPDFRAAEQSFQLLTQVAGRAGRGDRPGTVFVQTYRPNHYAVQCAAGHDYHAFFDREMRERRQAGYPPFRRMVNLAVEAEDPLVAEKYAARLSRNARDIIQAGPPGAIQILGPAPAAVFRVKKKYRWNLAMLCRSARTLNDAARAIRDAFTAEAQGSGASLKVDPDPYGVF